MPASSHHRRSGTQVYQRRRGALTLEWVLLATLIVIGTVGGVAAVRNALILEYQEMIETICDTSVGP